MGEFKVIFHVNAWTFAGKLRELPDEMRLVVVTALVNQVVPVGDLPPLISQLCTETPHPPDAGVIFWTYPSTLR